MAERDSSESEILEFVPDDIEKVPEAPGVYRILSFGQKVVYIGHAGEEGLKDALWELYESNAIGGAGEFQVRVCESPEKATERAREEIEALKPIYNIGFGRFRNEGVTVPRQGHAVRRQGLDHP